MLIWPGKKVKKIKLALLLLDLIKNHQNFYEYIQLIFTSYLIHYIQDKPQHYGRLYFTFASVIHYFPWKHHIIINRGIKMIRWVDTLKQAKNHKKLPAFSPILFVKAKGLVSYNFGRSWKIKP